MMLRSMIEWLASFGSTESNGVTRLLYSKEWMNAQQAMKAEMEKENIIHILVVWATCLAGLRERIPPVESFIPVLI